MKTSYKIKRQIKILYHHYLHWKYRRQMRQHLRPPSDSYDDYLNMQLKRTIIKNDNQLKERTIYLVDKLAQFVNLNQAEILCVGCRNHAEIDYFYAKGVKKILGIDLMSKHSDILVMDMHQMTFPDNSFNVVYSSHSLEHAYDPQKVINEIKRICRPGGYVVIEVPIRYETTSADRIDFGGSEKLLSAFAPDVAQVLLAEDDTFTSKGTDVARAIFQIK